MENQSSYKMRKIRDNEKQKAIKQQKEQSEEDIDLIKKNNSPKR